MRSGREYARIKDSFGTASSIFNARHRNKTFKNKTKQIQQYVIGNKINFDK